ncbi:MAG: RsmE family RNA methyltransferase [Chloroflexi bacterium]|nr:RsmE family RNA methyltransferase [Chloroflexota bacterium]
MHRFFLPLECFQPGEITIPAEISRQISRVLRLRAGTSILLLDNQGFEMGAELSQVSDQGCKAIVQFRQIARGEPETYLTMIMGLTQREKFEWILQKCTEIGVSAFIPVVTSRSLVQKPEEVLEKYPRWRKILVEAAEQSHRGRIPLLHPAVGLESLLSKEYPDDELRLVLWEDEKEANLREQLQKTGQKKITLLVGPEGGFSTGEVTSAIEAGFISVSLGNRILRMETAAILSAGLALYEMG